MPFRKKSQSASLRTAHEELERSRQRAHHVDRIVTVVTKTLEENHLGYKMKRALR